MSKRRTWPPTKKALRTVRRAAARVAGRAVLTFKIGRLSISLQLDQVEVQAYPRDSDAR